MCFALIVHFRNTISFITSTIPSHSNQLIESANRWRHDRFKAIITDSNKRQSLSRCVRELDNMYRHIRRILIVSCRSVLVIYLRDLSINLLFIGIIVGIIGDIYARAYYVNDIYIDRWCSIYIVHRSSRCTVPKNLVGDTERLKSAFIQWCVRTMSILAPLSFVTHLTATFHLSTSVTWWKNASVCDSIRVEYRHVRRFMIAILQDKSWETCITCGGTLLRFNRCFILHTGMHPEIYYFPRFNIDSEDS